MKAALCAGLLLLTTSLPLAAESSSEAWQIGLAVTSKQSPFRDGEAQLGIKPVVIKETGFDIRGPALALHQAPQRELYIGLGLDDWDSKRGDSPLVRDLPKLDTAVHVRLGSAWKLPNGSFNAELAQGLNAHQARHAKLRYTHHPRTLFRLRPYVEWQWLEADMVDYYVGVLPAQVQPQRPAYRPKAAQALKGGVRLDYALSQRLTLVVEAEATGYDKAITASPLIAKDAIWGGAVGLAYRW